MNHQLRATRRIAAAIGVLLTASAALAGCGGDADGADSTTLRVNVFGNFGYEELYDQFEKDHPGVKIVETAEGDLGAVQHPAHPEDRGRQRGRRRGRDRGGPGRQLPPERGQVRELPGPRLQRPQGPVAALEVRAGHHRRRRRPPSASAPTSAAWPCATARDLFEQAGLPTDRDEVAALWPTWEDFIAVGEQFQEGIGSDDVHFIDSATNTYNSILMQSRRPHLLRHRRQPRHRGQPGGQGRPGTPSLDDGRRRASAPS